MFQATKQNGSLKKNKSMYPPGSYINAFSNQFDSVKKYYSQFNFYFKDFLH